MIRKYEKCLEYYRLSTGRNVRKYRRFYTIKLINVPILLAEVYEQADRHNSIIIMKYTLKAAVTYLLNSLYELSLHQTELLV